MRVIGGSLGGRRLRAPVGRGTRPTAERVREALFSILGDIDDASVLDLYAGSGALGIEALSRGAASAVFVERSASALAALRGNLQDLGLYAPAVQVRRADVLGALGTARRRHETYDLVFIDPPYRRAAALQSQLSTALAPLLTSGARVVTESGLRSPLTLDFDALAERRYGDTVLTIHGQP